MIVLVYLIVLLRELLVSTIFAWCIPTSPFFLHLLHFFLLHSYAHAYVNITPRMFRESKIA